MTGPEYEIVHLTQHWRRLYGVWYRDAIVRDASGCLSALSIRDDLL